jgi:hypothetical protein
MTVFLDRYLVIGYHTTGYGYSGRVSCRITKGKPSLAMDEVAIHLNLELPNSLFSKPLIEGKIVVDEKAVTPTQLSPEILITTAQEIEKQTGMKVELKVIEAEKPEGGSSHGTS